MWGVWVCAGVCVTPRTVVHVRCVYVGVHVGVSVYEGVSVPVCSCVYVGVSV